MFTFKLFVFFVLGFVLLGGATNLTFVTAQLTIQYKEGPKITMDHDLKAELLVKGEIKFPTSMAFLGPNDLLVLEKNEGTVNRIVNGTKLPEPLLDVNVANKNERGMLGIAIARDFLSQNEKEDMKTKSNDTTYVFLYYTESKDKDGDDLTKNIQPLGNRLYRYELAFDKLVNPKLLLDLPNTQKGLHNGGKIIVGPDNNLYLVVGNIDYNKSKEENVVDGKNANGSAGILRITQDGKAVTNVLGKEGYLDKYYAYGIRNSFGIAFDPVTGNLWDTENGPDYGDEINLVRPGFNSGWGKVQGVWEPKNETIGDVFHDIKELVNFKGKGKYSFPEFIWNKTVGCTDIVFLNSSKLGKNYENDMFVGDFHNGYLYHFKLNDDRMELSLEKPLYDKIANSNDELDKVIFAKGFGGITDIEVGPDGYLYVLATNLGGGNCDPNLPNEPCIQYSGRNTGGVFRIVPAK